MKSTGHISRVRVVAWTIAVSLAVGLLGVGQPGELLLRNAANLVHPRQASGQIVLVAIDDKSLDEQGKFPWPRRDMATLITGLDRLGAGSIYIDGDFSPKTDPANDLALQAAFAHTRSKVTVGTHDVPDMVSGKLSDSPPNALFRDYTDMAGINVLYNYWGMIVRLPYSWPSAGTIVPSLSAKMAGRHGPPGAEYPIDFSTTPESVPVVSAVDILRNRVSPDRIAGKKVVIGIASARIGDIYLAPIYGQIPGVFFHILGAETLMRGSPIDLGWAGPFILAIVFLGAATQLRSMKYVVALLAIAAVPLIVVSLTLQHWLIFVEIVPASLLLVLAASRFAWLDFRNSYRVRGTINAISGLPNLKALRDLAVDRDRTLIVGRIQNFAEIASTLAPEREKALVDQIVKRLTVASPATQLYQGDEGSFAWLAEHIHADELDDHLSALRSLFRQPIILDDEQIDLAINFGIDRDAGRSIANRLGSAQVAAEEAAAAGLSWKDHDPATLKDAPWKLSLLSQLDAAIDAGDLWVAYQAKVDLATGAIVGAEALVRWTHPEKGVIQPDHFIRAAEQGNRIDRLTLFVLDQALSATADILAGGIDFGIAVNLSARLVEEPTLVIAIAALLDQHDIDPRHLTLEITETASLGQTPNSLDTLHQIRALGIGLSIDDYGTGMSTLDYLRRIPATQIKIDRGFVDAIDRGGGDLVMVNSTIQLAHSLGLEVVAEGVERQRTRDILADLGCDTAQGYLIGRPLPLSDFLRTVRADAAQRNVAQIRL